MLKALGLGPATPIIKASWYNSTPWVGIVQVRKDKEVKKEKHKTFNARGGFQVSLPPRGLVQINLPVGLNQGNDILGIVNFFLKKLSPQPGKT